MTTLNVPLSRVEIDDEVKAAVMTAVESGQYILGPQSKAFEKELAAWFGREHCVLVNSATSGLMLTMQALGIGAGDEVLAPAHTAFPTIEAIYLAGADPHEGDRLGRLKLTRAGLERRDERVFDRLRQRGIAVTIAMAGGYGHDIDDTVAIHAATILAARRILG